MKSTVGIANRKRIIKGIRSLQNQGGAEHPRMAPRMNDNCLPGELPHPQAPFAWGIKAHLLLTVVDCEVKLPQWLPLDPDKSGD